MKILYFQNSVFMAICLVVFLLQSHVVVCGFIDFKTVRGFLGDFLHEDRETKHIKCIFLDTLVKHICQL